MAAPKKIDYEHIEPAWRAGILSPHQLAAEYMESTGVSVSHAAIIKHFKKTGVPRDLKGKIQAKANAMVSESLVTGKVTVTSRIPEKTIVEANAMNIAGVRLEHRGDIMRMRRLVLAMLTELEIETDDPALFEELGDFLRAEDDKGQDKRNDVYRKVISSAGRIDSMKKLAETLRILIALEREAYGIVEGESAEKEAAALIARTRVVMVPMKQVAEIITSTLVKNDG